MQGKAFVAGVGTVPFGKPGATDPYDVMAAAATRKALENAGLSYQAVQQAIVGYVYGDSTSGQRALYGVGMTGIPIVNVNNNCSTGSTALFLARQLVESGAVDCVLALGFEQMQPGALTEHWRDRPSPFARFDTLCDEIAPYPVPLALRYFGGAGKEYMERYQVGANVFARVRAKASRHAAHNPTALLRKVVSEEEVMAAPLICAEAGMTRLMACPPTCGAAAAILVSQGFAETPESRPARLHRRAGDDHRPPGHLRQAQHDRAGRRRHEPRGGRPGLPAGRDRTRGSSTLSNCTTASRRTRSSATKRCACVRRAAPRSSSPMATTRTAAAWWSTLRAVCCARGTRWVPPGLAQCAELVEQLRGAAGERQVARRQTWRLQHNLGLGGACVVTLYQRAD
jgi:sterol carrier protein 2